MLSEGEAAAAEANFGGDGAATEDKTAEMELAEMFNKGPAELLSFMEASFEKIENTVRHNSKVMEQQAEDIMRKVDEIDASLHNILQQLGEHTGNDTATVMEHVDHGEVDEPADGVEKGVDANVRIQ